MKNKAKKSAVVALLMGLIFVSCEDYDPKIHVNTKYEVTNTVIVNNDTVFSAEFDNNGTCSLEIRVGIKATLQSECEWTSLNSEIASVKDNVITALKAGKTNLVNNEDESKKISVTVIDK